jgi:hypothetical protein
MLRGNDRSVVLTMGRSWTIKGQNRRGLLISKPAEGLKMFPAGRSGNEQTRMVTYVEL